MCDKSGKIRAQHEFDRGMDFSEPDMSGEEADGGLTINFDANPCSKLEKVVLKPRKKDQFESTDRVIALKRPGNIRQIAEYGWNIHIKGPTAHDEIDLYLGLEQFIVLNGVAQVYRSNPKNKVISAYFFGKRSFDSNGRFNVADYLLIDRHTIKDSEGIKLESIIMNELELINRLKDKGVEKPEMKTPVAVCLIQNKTVSMEYMNTNLELPKFYEMQLVQINPKSRELRVAMVDKQCNEFKRTPFMVYKPK
ncbi:MAG TPA: hypothetical protein ENN30_02210 [Candidatus Woesearchaeota archaeon]|nr:hypothetical protein [Candidatus Woesearchaeota archaeon]